MRSDRRVEQDAPSSERKTAIGQKQSFERVYKMHDDSV
jgi:hypothetical protein